MIVLAQVSAELPLWVYIVSLVLGNSTGIGIILWRKRRKNQPNKQQEE